MAPGHLDFIRETYAAWNAGTFEEWKAMHREDVVVVPPQGFPDGKPTDDRDAWSSQAMRLRDSWEDQRIELDELLELPGTS